MFKFDTRDKKPKVYNILILSAAMLTAVTVLLVIDSARFIPAVCILLDVYSLCVMIMLIAAFFKQLQYNPYSYNTIYYISFAILMLTVLFTGVYTAFRFLRANAVYNLESLFGFFKSTGDLFMLISFPFIFIFSAGLFISNISLIRHEGFRFVNILGILLALALVFANVFLFMGNYYVTGSEFEVMIHDLIFSFLSTVYLYYECMLIGTIVADVIAARHEPEPGRDFVIILGCGLRKDGTPTPLLKGRCDRALEYAKMQEEKTGKKVMFITSGGQGPDEAVSESAAMKSYLIENGISPERIIEEDKSASTYENMLFSKEKIQVVNPEGKVLFSTTNYHVFRSGIWARRVKMRAVGIGAPTKWYFWPNASVREFLGLLTAHRGKQALILAGLITVYIALTLLQYLIR